VTHHTTPYVTGELCVDDCGIRIWIAEQFFAMTLGAPPWL
jgi:hypothetical protein